MTHVRDLFAGHQVYLERVDDRWQVRLVNQNGHTVWSRTYNYSVAAGKAAQEWSDVLNDDSELSERVRIVARTEVSRVLQEAARRHEAGEPPAEINQGTTSSDSLREWFEREMNK